MKAKIILISLFAIILITGAIGYNQWAHKINYDVYSPEGILLAEDQEFILFTKLVGSGEFLEDGECFNITGDSFTVSNGYQIIVNRDNESRMTAVCQYASIKIKKEMIYTPMDLDRSLVLRNTDCTCKDKRWFGCYALTCENEDGYLIKFRQRFSLW